VGYKIEKYLLNCNGMPMLRIQHDHTTQLTWLA